MKETILIAGSGGQGVLLAGRVLAGAAMLMDMQVTWFPSYGAEMRGGTANCTVVISDKLIGSPVAARVDVLIALNGESLAALEGRVREGGILVMDSSKIKISTSRNDLTVLKVPGARIARSAGSPKSVNMALLGAFIGASGTVTLEAAEQAIDAADIHDAEINKEAMRLGRQYSADKKGQDG